VVGEYIVAVASPRFNRGPFFSPSDLRGDTRAREYAVNFYARSFFLLFSLSLSLFFFLTGTSAREQARKRNDVTNVADELVARS